MKAIRYFTIALIFLVMLAVFLYIGINIGASFGTPGFPLDGAIIGFFGGLVVGIPLAIGIADFFAKYIWSLEKPQNSSITDQNVQQQAWNLENRQPEVERQRVEKYGTKIVICSSCGTKNSLSFSYCLKCFKDLSREQPVDNPYLA